jgi:hypothetical protein
MCKAQIVPAAQIEIANKQYSLLGISNPEVQKLMDEYLSKKIPNVFYLHVSGIEFNHKMSKGTEKWLVYRSAPMKSFEPLYKLKVWSTVLQRNTNAKHGTYVRSYDVGSHVQEYVEQERINVIYFIHESINNIKDRLKFHNGYKMVYSCDFLAIADSIETNTKNIRIPYLCTFDMEVKFAIGNLDVVFRTNFTDFNEQNSLLEVCKKSIPLELAIAIYEYLDKPFPPRSKIRYPETKFFHTFSTPKEVFRIGEEMKLDIAYTLEAARNPEWIRLRATSGEFRRDKDNIYYKATTAGKQTLFLEAISGTNLDHTISIAEQLKHDIVVVTGKESSADIDRIAGYRSWTALDWSVTVTAKLISIEHIEFIEIDKIDYNKLADYIVTIETKENKKQIKVKFGSLSTNDKDYIAEQIKTKKLL